MNEKARCELCCHELDPSVAFREIEGWAVVDAVDTGPLMGVQHTGRYACERCLSERDKASSVFGEVVPI